MSGGPVKLRALVGDVQSDLPILAVLAAAIPALPPSVLATISSNAILYLAGDPVPGDIPAGTARVAKNTTTGRLSHWANDGGTIVDLLALV